MLAVNLILASVGVVGVAPVVSAAPGSGSISGRVLDKKGDGLAGVCVSVQKVASTNTDAAGNYALSNIPAGQHVIQFSDCATPRVYLTQWYLGQTDQASAKPVQVFEGSHTTLQDVLMVAGASVSGRVTDGDNNPIADICVSANTPSDNGWDGTGFTNTDIDGNYIISGLQPTQTHILFSQCNSPAHFADQWYSAATSFEESQALHLQPGDALGGIDATMVAGTPITGRVTDSGGNPLPGVWVSVEPDGKSTHGSGSTDANGIYTTSAMPPGAYRVRFTDASGLHATEYWNDAPSYRAASLVTITSGAPTVTGIDASLAVGARISGTVTRPDNAPAGKICIGAVYISGAEPDGVGWVETDAAGRYNIAGLPAGSYRIQFKDCNGQGPYQEQWYDGTDHFNVATIIKLAPGDDRTGVDAQMQPATEIQGAVTNAAGDPLSTVCVQASTATATAGFTHTDNDGTYSLQVPGGGDYRLQFVDCGDESDGAPIPGGKYLGQWYGGGLEPDTAVPVTVVANETTSGIDAVLDLAGGTGTITGKVSNVRGEPLASCIALFIPDDHVMFGMTDGDGNYRFDDVPTGSWHLGFLGCGDDDVSPVVADGDHTGVSFWGQWWKGVPLEIGEDGAPDPIAQGATSIVVHPGESITADQCFGCRGVAVTSFTTNAKANSVTVRFDTPGIAESDIATAAAKGALTYAVSCTSGTKPAVSASGPASPLTVTGLTPGLRYRCAARAMSAAMSVADSAPFEVTVDIASTSVPNPAAPTRPGTGLTGPSRPGAATRSDSPGAQPASAQRAGARDGRRAPAPKSLAVTGTDIADLVLLALALVLIGAGVISVTPRVGRRRPATESSPVE